MYQIKDKSMITDDRYYSLINRHLNLRELLPKYNNVFGNEPSSKEHDLELSLLSCAIFMRFVEDLPNEKFYKYINKQISKKSEQIAKKKQIKREDKRPLDDLINVGAIMLSQDEDKLKSFVEKFYDKSSEGYYSNFSQFMRVEQIKDNLLTSVFFMIEKDNICDFSLDIFENRLNKYRADLQKCVSQNNYRLPFYILNTLCKTPTKFFISRLFYNNKALQLKLALKQILEESYENCTDCYLHLVLSNNPPWSDIEYNDKPKFYDWVEPTLPPLTYDEEQLYEIIKRHINVRKSLIQIRRYAKIIISDKTETEIAIFSCAVLIFQKSAIKNEFYSMIENGMVSILMNMAYRHRLWNYVDEKLIQKRVVEYHEDIKQCLSDEPTELPYRSYFYLFNEPLAKEFIQQDFDVSSVTQFSGVLKKIVHEHNEVFERICFDFFMYKKKF